MRDNIEKIGGYETFLRQAGAIIIISAQLLAVQEWFFSRSNGDVDCDVFVGRRPKVHLEVRATHTQSHLRVPFGWGFSQMSHVNNVEIRDPNMSTAKSKPGLAAFPSSVQQTIKFASQTVTRTGAIRGSVPASANEFFSASALQPPLNAINPIDPKCQLARQLLGACPIPVHGGRNEPAILIATLC